MVVAAVLFRASAIGSALAQSLTGLIVWRVIGGLGVGFASVLAPAYIAEVSPADQRGRLGSLQQLAIVVGIFLALLFDYAIVLFTPDRNPVSAVGPLAAWRWMLLSEVLPERSTGCWCWGFRKVPATSCRKGCPSRPVW